MAYEPFDITTASNKGCAWAKRLLDKSPKSALLKRLISKIKDGVLDANMQNATETIFYGNGVFDAASPLNVSSFRKCGSGWMSNSAISNVIRSAIYETLPKNLIGEIRMYDTDDIITWISCDDSHSTMAFTNEGLVLNPCVIKPNPYLLVEKDTKLRFDPSFLNLWQTLEGINIFIDDTPCKRTAKNLGISRYFQSFPSEAAFCQHINQRARQFCAALYQNTEAFRAKCACFPTFIIRHLETNEKAIYASPSHIKITNNNVTLAYSIDIKEFPYKNNNPKIIFHSALSAIPLPDPDMPNP